MKKEKLSDAIGKLDDDIIEEADKVRNNAAQHEKPRKKKPLLIATSLFAAAAAAVTGVVVIPRLSDSSVTTDDTPAITTTAAAVTGAKIPGDDNGISVGAGEYDEHAPTDARGRRRSGIVSDVSAVVTDGDSISPDSGFRITLAADVSEDTLRDRIRLSPESEFTLTRESESSYLLKTSAELAKGSLVKLAVEDSDGEVCDSWAFRTADSFTVTDTYPADGASGVFADTGIEITFSEHHDLKDIDKYFEISPRVTGEFREFLGTLYFIPDSTLDANTVYTVTVKAGYTAANGDILEEDCSFSFRTTAYGDDGTYMFTGSSNSGFSEAFLTSDRACVEIYCSENLRRTPFETHLYRFDDTADYLAAIEGKAAAKWADEYTIETIGLPDVFSTSEAPFFRADNDPSVYVLLPEQLTKGCYVANISADIEGMPGFSLQYLVQVTNISVYSLALGDECIFYINDAASGLPASGASATLKTSVGEYTVTADENGIAYIKTKGETGKAVLSVVSDGGTYIDSYILSDAANIRYDDEFYSYIYTDRQAYLPSDTVRVFGVILPKTDNTELPSDLYLSFDSEKIAVSPDSRGTFTAQFTYKNHTSGWSNPISLMSGEDEIVDRSVRILDYNKPTYVLDLDTPEYVIMPQINPVDVTARVTYFEGTPAAGVLLKSERDSSDPETLRTDENGEAKATVLCQSPSRYQSDQNYSVGFEITGIEDSYTYVDKSIPALYHDRMITYDFDKESGSLALHTNEVDFSRIAEYFASAETDGWFYSGGDKDIIKGAPADIPVTVTVERSWTEQIPDGSYYDAVEKRNVDTYRYEYRSEYIIDETVTTSGGEYLFPSIPMDKPGSYFVTLAIKDSFGYDVEERFYPVSYSGYLAVMNKYGSMVGYAPGGNRIFRLDAGDTEYGMSQYFTEDEDITFTLRCNNDKTDFDGKLLFIVYRSDLITYEVHDLNGSDTFTYRAGTDCIPNARYTAAYFDGKHVYGVYGSDIIFDPAARDIELEVTNDAKTYDAGDTAVVTVKAVGADGKVVPDATVLLSVVDEAAFAVADQIADPLHEIYRYILYPTAQSYVSYIQHLGDNSSAGEKGGGGPDGARKDFRDTAFFMSAVTDSEGKVSFSVKLPDDLTTWRATVVAVKDGENGRVIAGTTRAPIVVTRPLFISPIMQQQFVEGDDIAVSARCAGLDRDGDITVTISGNGTDKTVTIKQQQTANFGKLPTGDYTVTFTAEKDSYKDAVELPISVTDTLLETYITKSFDLNELTEGAAPTKWPLNAAFFNKAYMFRTDVMYSLLGYYGNDLASRLASEYSALRLGFITEDDFISEFAGETENGFAKPLPAANENQSLSALISVLAPETIGSECARLLEKYTDTNNYSESEVCRSYMALAALDKPVMHSVKELLTANPDMSASGGIFLSAALALCGDSNAAYDAYVRFVPEITVNDTDPDAVFAYICNKNGEPDPELTRAAMIPASVLGLPEAELFARYLVSLDPHYTTYALELAIFLDRYVPADESEAVFTYTLDGETKTVSLERHRPTFITFTEEQFRSADFKVQSGDVYVIAGYVGKVGENSEAPTVTVSKTLTGETEPGSEITVDIKSAPYSVVYDVVPSCGKLSGSQQGQLVTLYTDKSGNASYKFTLSTEGEYVVESAVVYDRANGTWGIGERSQIKVGKSDEAV